MDFGSLAKTVAKVGNIVQRLVNTIKEAEAKKVAIELSNFIIALQSEILSIQSEHNKLLYIKNDLEKKLIEHENWDTEKSQYELKKVTPGVFVYSHKPNDDLAEPDHWLCANCFNNGKKSIIQPNPRSTSYWICPKCETLF